MTNKKVKEKDELLKMEIKFKEELLRLYKRISDLSGMSDRTQEETINRLLDDLSELYKRRSKK